MLKRIIQFQKPSILFFRRYSLSFSNCMYQGGVEERHYYYNNQKGKEYYDQRRRYNTNTTIIYREFFSTSSSSFKSDTNTNNNKKATTIIREEALTKIRHEEDKTRKNEEGGKENVLPKLTKQNSEVVPNSYQILKQYGPVFIGTNITLAMTTLGCFYGGISSGIIDPLIIMDYLINTTTSNGDIMEECGRITTAQVMIEYFNQYSWAVKSGVVPMLEKNPHFANLAVACVATSFTKPMRYLVCLAIVPRLAKYLGFIAPTAKEEVQ